MYTQEKARGAHYYVSQLHNVLKILEEPLMYQGDQLPIDHTMLISKWSPNFTLSIQSDHDSKLSIINII